jgi:hypothetical protein
MSQTNLGMMCSEGQGVTRDYGACEKLVSEGSRSSCPERLQLCLSSQPWATAQGFGQLRGNDPQL